MSKFCKNCGKEVKENEECVCKTEKVDTVNIDYVKEVKEIVIGMVKEPKKTIKNTVKVEFFNIAVVVILLAGLTGGILTNYASSLILGIISELTYGLAGTFLDTSFQFDVMIKSTLYTVVGLGALAGTVHILAEQVCKIKSDFKKIVSSLTGYAAISILYSVIAVIGIELGFNATIVFGIMACLGLLSIIYLYLGIEEAIQEAGEKVPYVFIAAILAYMLVVFKILPEILPLVDTASMF